jgi:single-strand DNA-binding protein
MSINRVNITGNLTRDPELRSTGSGMAVLQMGVAVNDRRKNQQTGEWEDSPNFIDVVMFGTRAESVSRFLSKGSKVAIEGKLRWSSWEDKTTGAKRSKVEVVVDDIEFMSSKSEGGGSGGGRDYAAPAAAAPSADPVIEDDIPF